MELNFTKFFAFGLIETLPQALLSGSLFALTFEETSDLGRAKQLLALALTALSLVKMFASMLCYTHYMYRAICWMHDDDDGCCKFMFCETGVARLFGLALCMLMTACVAPFAGAMALLVARVFFAFRCPDHVWNLTSGCVDTDTSQS
eukprot:TRINITY_DN17229_c0_g1_i2.p1 TRINITY_DN17229_c0_g1~~TRINITY_DN17229_c0_g1_i2.p1  ORF type:complete len:147 (-),score=24.67 TRINITY_DN17229_c0_g1_i2:146-586(-)